MDRPQMVGIGFAVAAAIAGTMGLSSLERIPPSARLGAMAGLDTDADGRISVGEWTGAGRAPAAHWALDTDRDGFLEPPEVKPRRGSAQKD